MSGTAQGRPRVVVIGSGFGGLFTTRALAQADVDVTVISRTSYHLFQPLLYQVATGILSIGDVAPATRIVLRRQKNAEVMLGEVVGIDLEARTVTSTMVGRQVTTGYDALVVAAGSGQSYFGHDEFAHFAPGMKTVDDALELRGRILGSFELAEASDDPEERARLMTFVVVGAGPTGVELAGQIAELSRHTLRGAFRNIDPAQARVILLDAADNVLPVYKGGRLSRAAARTLGRLGVEIRLGEMVTGMDDSGLTVRGADGREARIEARGKVWSAGVQASPLGALLAEQAGVEVDRAGRVPVGPDATLAGHPEVFVIGDMMTMPGKNLPGLAQVAMQQGRYAAKTIAGQIPPDRRKPFHYVDKGSMAIISSFNGVAQMGKLEITGLLGWAAWLFIHLMYLVGFQNRLNTFFAWTAAFTARKRAQLASTEQQTLGRVALERMRKEGPGGFGEEP
jgi:NADH dehydrogenase